MKQSFILRRWLRKIFSPAAGRARNTSPTDFSRRPSRNFQQRPPLALEALEELAMPNVLSDPLAGAITAFALPPGLTDVPATQLTVASTTLDRAASPPETPAVSFWPPTSSFECWLLC